MKKDLKARKNLPKIFGRLVDLFLYQVVILFFITYNTFLGEQNPPILWCARFTSSFAACNCQTRDYATLQVKVQNQTTKVANLPLWF